MLLSLPARCRFNSYNLMNINIHLYHTAGVRPFIRLKIKTITVALPWLLLVFSCGNNNQQNSAGFAAPMGTYKVLTLQPRPVTLNTDYPASIQGEQNIEIRPKVDGYVEKIFVDEGAIVKKGQLLF